LIISMEDEQYYSFADKGLIKKMYDEIDWNKEFITIK
jgi:hypothetical protein